jgi:uncharacterized membrane protein YedE/YeeE
MDNVVSDTTPALIGGLLIGLSASLVMFFYGRITGISSMLQSLIVRQKIVSSNSFTFLLGVILGAASLSILLNIKIEPPATHPAIIILSGLLVGYGTALGSGCTSGHGICGISRFSLRSIAATMCFMLSGIITVFVMRHLI